jgi:hypothetical protein
LSEEEKAGLREGAEILFQVLGRFFPCGSLEFVVAGQPAHGYFQKVLVHAEIFSGPTFSGKVHHRSIISQQNARKREGSASF